MRSYPRSRAFGESVREVVARALVEEIADPRIALVTITGVEMSPDLRHANVFFAIHGGEDRAREALDGLDSAKGQVRSLVGSELRVKYVPELHFRLDPSLEEGDRIEAAIRSEHRAGRGQKDVSGDEGGHDE